MPQIFLIFAFIELSYQLKSFYNFIFYNKAHTILIILLQVLPHMNFLHFLTSNQPISEFNLNNKGLNHGIEPINHQETSAFKPLKSELSLPNHFQHQLVKLVPINSDYEAIVREREALITQYLKLNLQLMEKQNVSEPILEMIPQSNSKVYLEEKEEIDGHSQKKKIKKITNCEHKDKDHYAKGMCSNCYHKFGRSKKPWNCTHNKLYASGMCQNCYINQYNKKKRQDAFIQGNKDQIDFPQIEAQKKTEKQIIDPENTGQSN